MKIAEIQQMRVELIEFHQISIELLLEGQSFTWFRIVLLYFSYLQQISAKPLTIYIYDRLYEELAISPNSYIFLFLGGIANACDYRPW